MRQFASGSQALLAPSIASDVDRIFDSRDISIPTKIAVYRAVLRPSLFYGSESWVLYRRQMRELEKFQRRQLRRIFGIQWSDFITSKVIIDKAGALPIETRLRWLGHIQRMDRRLSNMVLYAELADEKEKVQGPAPHFASANRNCEPMGAAGGR